MKSKKLTKKDKISLTESGICWKCFNKDLQHNKFTIICNFCGLKIQKFDIKIKKNNTIQQSL